MKRQLAELEIARKAGDASREEDLERLIAKLRRQLDDARRTRQD